MTAQRAESGTGHGELDMLRLSGQELSELLQVVLERGAPFTFRAAGGSMFRFIRDGDLVTASPLCSEPPRLGDVVVCMLPARAKLVVHRVAGRCGQRDMASRDLCRLLGTEAGCGAGGGHSLARGKRCAVQRPAGSKRGGQVGPGQAAPLTRRETALVQVTIV